MAWTTPLTAVSNAALTAAQWNASVRDNLAETAPSKATTAGRFFAVSGANTIAERVPSVGTNTGTDTTTGTAYGALSGSTGPAVTVTTGPNALVAISTFATNDTTGANAYASMVISGATTLAASDAWATGQTVSGTNRQIAASRVQLFNALTAGSNTFTMQYRVSGNTGSFSNRTITVIPF
jgi:hypothetical protein